MIITKQKANVNLSKEEQRQDVKITCTKQELKDDESDQSPKLKLNDDNYIITQSDNEFSEEKLPEKKQED